MEADWEIEIGPLAPIIDALWPGFIDLRHAPERIVEVEEAQWLPALAESLLRLNGAGFGPDYGEAGSQLWTAKCDLWTPEYCDPDEMDATPAESVFGLACYIDLLPRDGLVFAAFDEAEHWARAAVSRLRQAACRCCRVDLIVRNAFAGNQEGTGITAYIAACGPDADAAKKTLSVALITLVEKLETSAGPS
jgi:hypothetical protein